MCRVRWVLKFVNWEKMCCLHSAAHLISQCCRLMATALYQYCIQQYPLSGHVSPKSFCLASHKAPPWHINIASMKQILTWVRSLCNALLHVTHHFCRNINTDVLTGERGANNDSIPALITTQQDWCLCLYDEHNAMHILNMWNSIVHFINCLNLPTLRWDQSGSNSN